MPKQESETEASLEDRYESYVHHSLPMLTGKVVNVMRHKKKRYHTSDLAGEAQAPTLRYKPVGKSPNSTPQPYVSEIRPG